MTSKTNKAIIDGIEYRVLACHFDEDINGSGSLYMEILVERNDKVASNLYPFGSGFLFTIDVPSVHVTKSDGSILVEFDDPEKDSCVSVYTGEHDGLTNVRSTLSKAPDSWILQMKGIIDLIDEKKDFVISCEATSFHGTKFTSLSLPI